jgi:hypothetical protein
MLNEINVKIPSKQEAVSQARSKKSHMSEVI